MSETGSIPPAASAVPPPLRERRKLSPLLLVAIFVCGIVCGAGVTAVAIVHGVRYANRHPEFEINRETKRLTRRLDLNAGQTEQVRKILTEQSRELRPFVAARFQKTQAEIEKILTPEQQAKFRILVERWLPNLPQPLPPKPTAP